MLGVIFLLIVLVSLVLAVWSVVDAAIRPKDAFTLIGQNKVVWIALPLVGIVIFAPIGGAVGFVYLNVIRRKVLSLSTTRVR